MAILPRGEAIRNFIHTGALDALAQQAAVSLLTVLPNAAYRDDFDARFDDVHELRAGRDSWAVRIQRELLDMAHGRWLWSKAAQYRWELRDAEAKTLAAKLKRAAKKAACYPFANRAGLSILSESERRSSQRSPSTREYVQLFHTLQPSLVFNGSHVHSTNAIQAVRAAQQLGIPTAAFIFSWDNLTSQGRILSGYDHFLVWNDAIRDQLLQIYPGVRADQVTVTGTPQFDFHFRRDFYWTRDEFCRAVGADPDRPIVLYTTGMPNHMPGEPRIVKGIGRLIDNLPGRPQLLVRVSPKDRTDRFEALKAAHPEILVPRIPWEPAWYTPALDDCYLLTNMLRHAAVGINVASTVSLELCMFDKPVINVAYRPPLSDIDYGSYYDFDHYRPVAQSGAITLASSEAEMQDALARALTHPAEQRAERRALVDGMFGRSLDGRSSDRVVAALMEIA